MADRNWKIRFKTRVLRPAKPQNAAWFLFVLPPAAGGNLPAHSMVTVDGMLDSHPFQATLTPDGPGGHWLRRPA